MNLDNFNFCACYEEMVPLFDSYELAKCTEYEGFPRQRMNSKILEYMPRGDDDPIGTLTTIRRILIATYNSEYKKTFKL